MSKETIHNQPKEDFEAKEHITLKDVIELFGERSDDVEQLITALKSYNKKVEERVNDNPLVSNCTAGDRAAAEKMFIGIWPFIDQFWKNIDSATKTFFSRKKLVENLGRENAKKLLRISTDQLRAMSEEEGHHSKLWLEAARTFGLSKNDLESEPPPPETGDTDAAMLTDPETVIRLIGEGDYPMSDMLMRFAGVEMVAEALSKKLLASPEFVKLFEKNQRGLNWFRVHTPTEGHGLSHEELDLVLALAERDLPSQEEIQEARNHLETQKTFKGNELLEEMIGPLEEQVDMLMAAGERADNIERDYDRE